MGDFFRKSGGLLALCFLAVGLLLSFSACTLRIPLEHKYMSVSFDDAIAFFEDLYERGCRSIFENETLAWMRELHESYGLTVIFYCFYENEDGSFNLSMHGDRYAMEFQDNKDWLRFGFHAWNGHTNYEATSAEEAASDYSRAMDALASITGGGSCLEKVVRLANFKGNYDSVKAMANCACGIEGLLLADDDRKSYYFSPDFSRHLKESDAGSIDGLEFYATDLRLENCDNISSGLRENDEILIVFSHEWTLQEEKVQRNLLDACNYAVGNGYCFSFPHLGADG